MGQNGASSSSEAISTLQRSRTPTRKMDDANAFLAKPAFHMPDVRDHTSLQRMGDEHHGTPSGEASQTPKIEPHAAECTGVRLEVAFDATPIVRVLGDQGRLARRVLDAARSANETRPAW